MATPNKNQISIFGIAMAFVGTLIGAGYASGQELMQFFGDFGSMGLAGLVCSAGFFFLYGVLGIAVSQRMGTDNYSLVMSPAGKPLGAIIVDIAVFSFLFGIQVIMIAGSAALFAQQFGLPEIVGGIFVIVLVLLSTWWGVTSIMNAFKLAAPLLVAGTAIVAAVVILYPQVDPAASQHVATSQNVMIGNWFVSSVLYVFYNMLPGVCVLIPLGFMVSNNSKVVKGTIWGSAVLSGLGFVLISAIIKNYSFVSAEPMPMLTLAKSLSPICGYVYALFMFAAIFSTALGLMYAKLARLKSIPHYNIKHDRIAVVVMSSLALLLSKVGFVTLVGTVYPFYGYISGLIFLVLCFNYFYFAPGKNRQGS